jgi:tight adherence protein B
MNADLLRLLILLAVFVAVLTVGETMIGQWRSSRLQSRAVNKRLQLIANGGSREEVVESLLRHGRLDYAKLPFGIRGLVRKLDNSTAGAGLKISGLSILQRMALAAGALVLVLLLASVLSGYSLTLGRFLLFLCFGVSCSGVAPTLILSRMATKRRRQLVQQFPVALDVFVRALRAGHPVASALELLTTEMPDPIGTEFGIVYDEISYGASLRDALDAMATRCGIDDMHMFVVSLSVQQETGGNLAEILEGLSKVIRDKASMLLKVRALSSEGRTTSNILTALPLITFAALFIVNPQFYIEVAGDPIFIPAFAGLTASFLIGVIWIRRLVDLKV